jgi:hypothetical protein
MLAFSILSTIAFGLFFIAMIGRLYLKKEKFLFFTWGSDHSTTMMVTAGLILLVIAVWVFMS